MQEGNICVALITFFAARPLKFVPHFRGSLPFQPN